MRWRWLAMLLVACSTVAAVKVATPREAQANLRTRTVQHSVVTWTWHVPASLTQVRFTLQGASGDDSGNYIDEVSRPGLGGLGALVTATFRMGHGVQAGDRLTIVQGQTRPTTDLPLAGAPGGPNANSDAPRGGRGGGASGVYNNRTGRWLVVAGGGGGGGAPGELNPVGTAGGNADSNGATGTGQAGAAGRPCQEGTNPVAATAGEDGTPSARNGAGGGGGGGCGGGTGGQASELSAAGGSGGGGRSSWVYQARDVSRADGARGNGFVSLDVETYYQAAPEIIAPESVTLVVGQPVELNVKTTGSPPPDVRPSGTLPAGVRMSVPLFSGRLEVRGAPEPGSEGTYTLQVNIATSWGRDSKTITLVVERAPAPS